MYVWGGCVLQSGEYRGERWERGRGRCCTCAWSPEETKHREDREEIQSLSGWLDSFTSERIYFNWLFIDKVKKTQNFFYVSAETRLVALMRFTTELSIDSAKETCWFECVDVVFEKKSNIFIIFMEWNMQMFEWKSPWPISIAASGVLSVHQSAFWTSHLFSWQMWPNIWWFLVLKWEKSLLSSDFTLKWNEYYWSLDCLVTKTRLLTNVLFWLQEIVVVLL